MSLTFVNEQGGIATAGPPVPVPVPVSPLQSGVGFLRRKTRSGPKSRYFLSNLVDRSLRRVRRRVRFGLKHRAQTRSFALGAATGERCKRERDGGAGTAWWGSAGVAGSGGYEREMKIENLGDAGLVERGKE